MLVRSDVYLLPLQTVEPDMIPDGRKFYLHAKAVEPTDPPCPAFLASAVHDCTAAVAFVSFNKMNIPLPLITGEPCDVEFWVPHLRHNPFFNQAMLSLVSSANTYHRYHLTATLHLLS